MDTINTFVNLLRTFNDKIKSHGGIPWDFLFAVIPLSRHYVPAFMFIAAKIDHKRTIKIHFSHVS